MQLLFTNLFVKQLHKTGDKHLARDVELIITNVKKAVRISEISNLKKLKGHANVYRIRAGNWRIGLYLTGDTIEFAYVMKRSDIYKFFP